VLRVSLHIRYLRLKRGPARIVGSILAVVVLVAALFGTLHLLGHSVQAASNISSAVTSLTPFNNEGISSDANRSVGNFDFGGRSYSNDALTAAGFAPGQDLLIGGYAFQWVTPVAGSFDNWAHSEQVIPFSTTGGSIAFLGAGSSGTSSGMAFISYSDGTVQPFTLTMTDWTLCGGTCQIAPGNTEVVATPYRNTLGGKQTVNTYVFESSQSLLSGKTPLSVTLPRTTLHGHLHIFAVGTIPGSTSATVEGVSNDSTPTQGNLDGGGRSYSASALDAAGMVAGAELNVDGFIVQWPVIASNTKDDWGTRGAVVPLQGSGTTLVILGTAVDGQSSGTATITYTDGTTQTFTLAFSDWTLHGGTQQIIPADSIAAQMPYFNSSSGQQLVTTYVFLTSVSLVAGKTAQSVTLPGSVQGGKLCVFAVSGQPASSTSTSNSWPTYLENPGHSSYNAAETTLNSSNASQLQLLWKVNAPQGQSDQVTVANGIAYWGSWDGVLHATNASTGTDNWTANIGQQTVAACKPATVGVASTPTLGSIGSTPVVFVAGGNDAIYALNMTTGAVIWATALTPSTDYFIWDSPVLYNGSLYIGISSFGDCPRANGKLFQLSLATGTIQNVRVLPPTTCGKGGDGVGLADGGRQFWSHLLRDGKFWLHRRFKWLFRPGSQLG
jgi:hypothetical protein